MDKGGRPKMCGRPSESGKRAAFSLFGGGLLPVWRAPFPFVAVLVCFCSTATYGTESTGHVVQGKALAAADGCALVVVLPRREDEQLPSGTSLHALPARLGQVGEAVLLQIDKGEALLKGGTHHGLLARRDGGRYQHSAPCSGFRKESNALLYLSLRQPAGALHLQQDRPLQEKPVADGRERHASNGQAPLYAEEVGVLPLHQQPARVITQVVVPALQLVFLQQELVVVARLKEQAVLAVFFLLSCLLL